MISKGREVTDFMERRGLDILCVQETRWKAEKARCIGGEYKMWYCGSGNKKNGVACGQGSGIAESNRQDSMLEDGV